MDLDDSYTAATMKLGRGLIAILLVLATMLMAIPGIILYFGSVSDRDISRLSNVGQAYGAISTALSAIALGAVAYSTLYQAQQSRRELLRDWRDAHREIMLLIVNDPELLGPCVNEISDFESMEHFQRYVFTTVLINHWDAGRQLGTLPESGLRDEIGEDMFRSSVARELWRERHERMQRQGIVRTRRTFKILDAEYQRFLSRLEQGKDGRTPSP